ncbi:MAG TPA: hypothetical protein VFR41_06330, partial [Acidimicrobiia bacterium]|nr:hypothetical protein [Acidimicrobiia bacterium]
GVDAGKIHNGSSVASTITLVVAGSGTTEGTHTFVVDTTPTISVVGLVAQPVNIVLNLPETQWHPKSAATDVVFSEKSLKMSSVINNAGPLTLDVQCAPNGALQFVGVAAQSSEATTTTVPLSSQGGTTTTTVGGSGSSGSGPLPRTGVNVLLLLVLAAGLIDAGLGLIALAGRRTRA